LIVKTIDFKKQLNRRKVGMIPAMFRSNQASSRRHRFKEISIITLGLAVSEHCLGDVITLRNGKQIRVERSWAEGDKIRYEINGNIYGFSKSLVEKVEPGAYLPEPEESESKASRPYAKPIPPDLQQTLNVDKLKPSHEVSEIIVDGRPNQQKLREIQSEARRNPRKAEAQTRYKNALIELTNLELKNGDQGAATRSLQEYLSIDPAHLQASLALASMYLKQGQYFQAENVLSQAEVRNNQSSDLYYLLGTTYYLQDKNDNARRALRRSLDLGFRAEVDQLLKKIDGENEAENAFKQAGSFHFVLKYEGTETNQALGREILATLERSFVELESSLDYSPRESIVVILYTGEVFRDITRSPSWVGALNDGKIRLPIKGITRVDDSLSKILKHELTHSFVRLKTGVACPVWLNEGLAQYLSGESARGVVPLFKRAASENRLVPLRRLEAPFVNLSWAAATWAYQESLLAVEFLVKVYGMGDLQRVLLQSLSSPDFETALRETLRINYDVLEDQLREYLLKQ
jgi:tetratricopeptide (TPR) repeat protein